MKIFLQLIVIMLFICCKKADTIPVKQFFMVSIENGILCSVKGSLNDTIYYENKLPNSETNYSYSILNEHEKQKLEKVLRNYSMKNPMKNLDDTKEESIIILKSNQSRLYKIDWLSQNGKAIYNLMKDLEYKRKEISTIKKFWDVDVFVPSIQKGKLINSINSNDI